MLKLRNKLVIEATREPDFFAFYSPTLPGFSGVGHSIEDCVYRARLGMLDHVRVMKSLKLKIPPADRDASVLIQNQAGKGRSKAAA